MRGRFDGQAAAQVFWSDWTLAQNGAGVPVWASSRGIGLLGAALGGALGEQLAALSLASVIWPESDMTAHCGGFCFLGGNKK